MKNKNKQNAHTNKQTKNMQAKRNYWKVSSEIHPRIALLANMLQAKHNHNCMVANWEQLDQSQLSKVYCRQNAEGVPVLSLN